MRDCWLVLQVGDTIQPLSVGVGEITSNCIDILFRTRQPEF